MFLTTFLWKEQLAKVLLGFCLCDFGGTAIVYGVPSLGFHPVVNAILSIIIFLIIYKIITPLLKKYQNYRIKHSYICSEILIVLILSGWLSNFLSVSYTHLDVYKRQCSFFLCFGSRRNECNSLWGEKGEKSEYYCLLGRCIIQKIRCFL